ncbi:hypothetical protein TNIN_78641 [Trichonephila inaurata madagascariensis]|uniref:Uncharacterized protein n=1 Tax=Trichonephila inaurata madagascariensis TaxID=2747483 RepID=A0A8X7C701_9ARAC|nr:hypothetical protein TNIN_78641 [Trichonephila inaurata madagascariensis]
MPCQRARQSTCLMSFEKEGEGLGREGVSAIKAATSLMDGPERRCPAFSPTYTAFLCFGERGEGVRSARARLRMFSQHRFQHEIGNRMATFREVDGRWR